MVTAQQEVRAGDDIIIDAAFLGDQVEHGGPDNRIAEPAAQAVWDEGLGVLLEKIQRARDLLRPMWGVVSHSRLQAAAGCGAYTIMAF